MVLLKILQTEKLGKIRNEFIITVLETNLDKTLDDYFIYRPSVTSGII